MPISYDRKIILYDKQSLALVDLSTRGPGTYRVKLDMTGNSILSTLFVESADPGASVQVNYYDFTTGDQVGEQNALRSHISLSAPLATDKILVSNAHDKVVLEAVITGGNVRFSVYGTIVSSSVSDSDSALVKEGQAVDFNLQKANPIAGVEEDSDTWKFARIDDKGNLHVKTSLGVAGDPFFQVYEGQTTPGIQQEIINVTVPEDKTRHLSLFRISTRQSGTYQILAGADTIASGRLNPMIINDIFEWKPSYPVSENTVIKVMFETFSGRPVSDLDAYLMGVDS